jgi:hypothetical protein
MAIRLYQVFGTRKFITVEGSEALSLGEYTHTTGNVFKAMEQSGLLKSVRMSDNPKRPYKTRHHWYISPALATDLNAQGIEPQSENHK